MNFDAESSGSLANPVIVQAGEITNFTSQAAADGEALLQGLAMLDCFWVNNPVKAKCAQSRPGFLSYWLPTQHAVDRDFAIVTGTGRDNDGQYADVEPGAYQFVEIARNTYQSR